MKGFLNRKVSIGSILLVAFILVFSATAIAAYSTTVQATLSPDVTLSFNGQEQTLRNANNEVVYPIIYEGSTYLPVRSIANLFGADIDWIDSTRTVSITGADRAADTDYGQLTGRWQFQSGDYIYFFGRDSDIEFFPDWTVFEYGYEEAGEYIMGAGGQFFVIGELGGFHRFEYSVSGDRLTITDRDGDSAVYSRTQSLPARNISELAGMWRFQSGVYIYFFGMDSDVEFFADGTAFGYEFAERVAVTMIGSGQFVIRGYEGGILTFSYTLSENRLTITDVDGDTAVFERVR